MVGWRKRSRNLLSDGLVVLVTTAVSIACGSDTQSGHGSLASGGQTAVASGGGGTSGASGGASNGGASVVSGGAGGTAGSSAVASGGSVTMMDGSTSGGAPNAGSGGTSGSKGSGGANGSGGADAGGTGSNVDAGSNYHGAGVRCGETTCSETKLCCFTGGTSLMPAPAAAYVCSDKPCAATDVLLSCDGAEDCAAPEACIQSTTNKSYVCGTTTPSSTVIGCGGSWDCPSKSVCCERTAPNVRTECADACANNPTDAKLCTTSADCPSVTPTCVLSILIPGFQHCQ